MGFSTVYIKTLGCKVNSFDSDVIEHQFRTKGYRMVSSVADADVTIINTCSVTRAAEKEARYLLRRYSKENPATYKVVTGCYAQVDQDALKQIQEIDLIVPNQKKEQIVSLIESKGDASKLQDENSSIDNEEHSSFHKRGLLQFQSSSILFDATSRKKTRAFVKIQDGCNGFCAYCQIPYARGSSRSVPPNKVISHIDDLIHQGTLEIVLTGIDIGDYGKDLTEEAVSLASLLEKIFSLEGLKRIRLSSIEPGDMTDDLLEVIKENKHFFCDHFHLPLQSGSDAILKRMGRSYSCEQYFEVVCKIKECFPDAMISADIIPGFPSEKEEEFQETIAFIKKCGISMLHVFPYSKRPNTRALRMPEHVEPLIVKERARMLRDLSKRLLLDFIKKQIGTEASVLWEAKKDSQQRYFGKTRNYMDVVLADSNNKLIQGTETRVVLKGLIGSTKVLGIGI